MKKLLWIVVLGLLWCNTVFSVEVSWSGDSTVGWNSNESNSTAANSAKSLTEGQKGTIKFESIPVVTLNQFLKGETIGRFCKNFRKIKISKKKMDRSSPSCCYTTWWRWWWY